MPPGPRPAVLLDRDGVLNVDRPDFVTSPDDLEMIPGTAEALHLLHDAGFLLLVVSNQSCVGRGLATRSAVDAVNRAIDRRVDDLIDGWYVCPHAPDERCGCRKPEPGLIEAALTDWGFDPGRTWLVADAARDVEAARRAGCRPVLVRTGKGRRAAEELPDVPVFDDLLAVARRLSRSRPSG